MNTQNLITQNLGIIYSTVNKHMTKIQKARLDDAFSIAVAKSVEAARFYNPKKGKPSTYFSTVVKNVIKTSIEDQFSEVRIANLMTTSLDQPVKIGNDEGSMRYEIIPSPEFDFTENCDDKIIKNRFFDMYTFFLSPFEKKIAENYFANKSSVALAKEMGITHQAVSLRYQKLKSYTNLIASVNNEENFESFCKKNENLDKDYLKAIFSLGRAIFGFQKMNGDVCFKFCNQKVKRQIMLEKIKNIFPGKNAQLILDVYTSFKNINLEELIEAEKYNKMIVNDVRQNEAYDLLSVMAKMKDIHSLPINQNIFSGCRHNKYFAIAFLYTFNENVKARIDFNLKLITPERKKRFIETCCKIECKAAELEKGKE